MNVKQYIKAVDAGRITAGTGVAQDEAIIASVRRLSINDSVEDLTAEAYNQEIFDETDDWNASLTIIRAAIVAEREG